VPLDERWDIVDTGFSPAVRESLAWVEAELPFARGVKLLEQLVDLRVSKQRGQLIAEQFGQQIEQQWQHQTSDEQSRPASAAPIERLYISADGTTVNTRQGWKEVKVGSIFAAHTDRQGHPVRGPTRYLARFEHADPFGWRLWQAASRAGLEQAQEVIVIGDGAAWIWNLADLHFHRAVQIVDWYHALERLWEVARAVFGEDSSKTKLWVKRREAQLWEGQVERVIAALKRMTPYRKAVRKTVATAVGYFERNRHRMRYGEFRANGYFIGSGVVEAGCKHLVAQRLKMSGMRWSIQGANRILQLRICILNEHWESFWQWRRLNRRRAA
jgi:hypothetical protein